MINIYLDIQFNYIQYNQNSNYIDAEFEQFYHGLLRDISNIPEKNLSTLKTKLRSACKKCIRIKVPHIYQQTVKELSKNQNIVIMRQDKIYPVVIMGKSKIQPIEPRERFKDTRK